jgi:hypothetical protein
MVHQLRPRRRSRRYSKDQRSQSVYLGSTRRAKFAAICNVVTGGQTVVVLPTILLRTCEPSTVLSKNTVC